MFNYARMTPVYLPPMYELKEKDSETWEFFMNDYFSLIKHQWHSLLLGPITLLNMAIEQLKY